MNAPRSPDHIRKFLLACGVVSSALYVAMTVFVAARWEAYSSVSQTVSELSAIGAPTRSLWVVLATVYTLLAAAFAWGVLESAGANRHLRRVGWTLLAYGVLGIFWPPMHLRGAEFTVTDGLHIAFAAVTVPLMFLAIAFGAAAFGRRFRLFSIATLAILVAAGVPTGLQGPNIAKNLPTPTIGLWERISMGAFFLWVAVLAVALWSLPRSRSISWMTIRAYVARHPVISYFSLTFAISWCSALTVIGGTSEIPGRPDRTAALLPFAVLALVSGPTLASLLLTGIIKGRSGFRELWASLRVWRVDARWYSVALLTAPVLATAALVVFLPISPAYLPGIVAAQDRSPVILGAIIAGLVAGIFEELGWTGFVTPRLLSRHDIFTTGLMVGLAWGAWHLIAAFWGSGDADGRFSVVLFWPQFLFYATVLPAYRILMVWVYDRTQSLLVAMLMHATLTGFVLFILMPKALAGIPLSYWYLALAVALWVGVGAVAVAGGFPRHRYDSQRRILRA
jgi:membrane protease YdiL (CAAX protease family)